MSGAGITAFGSMVGTVGKMQQLQSAQNAQENNAFALEEQAKLVEKANARKLGLLKTEQERFTGRTKSAFAKAGISLEGSALQMVAQDQAEMTFERNAVAAQQAYDVRRIKSAAQEARDAADAYGDARKYTLLTGMLSLGAVGTDAATTNNRNDRVAARNAELRSGS